MSPICLFRKICNDAGVHTLSHLAVLDIINDGRSCRSVGDALGIPASTVWDITAALEQQELIELTDAPSRGRYGKRLMLALSPTGRKLIADLSSILTPPSPTSTDPK